MIFKQIPEILEGRKTQTRRVVNKYERWATTADLTVLTSDRIKWQVGRTYAVQPGRGQPAVWWKAANGRMYQNSGTYLHLEAEGWHQARIRIAAIRREPLQSITEEDAKAEGVGSVAEYRALWDSINGKTKGARWNDNPDVWVLTFELVKGAA